MSHEVNNRRRGRFRMLHMPRRSFHLPRAVGPTLCVNFPSLPASSAAPSTVPIMHQVSATMRSITLSWPQPEQPNGIILDYEIRYYEKVSRICTPDVSSTVGSRPAGVSSGGKPRDGGWAWGRVELHTALLGGCSGPELAGSRGTLMSFESSSLGRVWMVGQAVGWAPGHPHWLWRVGATRNQGKGSSVAAADGNSSPVGSIFSSASVPVAALALVSAGVSRDPEREDSVKRKRRDMVRTGKGYQGCPCPGSLPSARSFRWQPSFPTGDTLSTLAVNCAEPKLFHPSRLSPALMNSSKCE